MISRVWRHTDYINLCPICQSGQITHEIGLRFVASTELNFFADSPSAESSVIIPAATGSATSRSSYPPRQPCHWSGRSSRCSNKFDTKQGTLHSILMLSVNTAPPNIRTTRCPRDLQYAGHDNLGRPWRCSNGADRSNRGQSLTSLTVEPGEDIR